MSAATQGLRSHGFAGPEDYIERITYQIWNEPRDVDCIATYYGPHTRIHMAGGELVGAASVLDNTRARLTAYPDFHGRIEDTIWTGSEDRGYRTSMRWTWTGTNAGPSAVGPATGKRVTVQAIANCVVDGQVIVEEWLGVNPLSQIRQLGLATHDVIRRLPAPFARPTSRLGRSDVSGRAGEVVLEALNGLLGTGGSSGSPRGFHPHCYSAFSADDHAHGIERLVQWAQTLSTQVPDLRLELDDQYEQPGPDDTVRVASQLFLTGTGPRGALNALVIAHHHVAEDRVVRQWLACDELDLARRGVVLARPTHHLAPSPARRI